MKLLPRSIWGARVLLNFQKCQKSFHAGYASYQFKVQKPIYYPDRHEESQRIENQMSTQLVADDTNNESLPKDHYYKLLGVPHNSSTTQIKTAYYALAKRYHPDAGKNLHKISKRFQDIICAYNILSDWNKRQEYDKSGKVKPQFVKIVKKDDLKTETIESKNPKTEMNTTAVVPTSVVPTSVVPKTTKIIKPLKTDVMNNPSVMNSDEIMQIAKVDPKLEITFIEAAHGVKKSVDVKYLRKCPACNGKWQRMAGRTSLDPCRKCNGSGQLTKRTSTYTSLTVCDVCNGKRYINRNQCEQCDNRGFVLIATSISVPVQPGVKTGDIITVENPDTKQNINYRITVQESDYYKRVGNDIFTEKYLTVCEAILGGIFKIRGIYQTLDVTLEPGVESHTQVILKGKGIKVSKSLGDHIVTFKIRIPRTLTLKQRHLVQALAKTEETVDRTPNE